MTSHAKVIQMDESRLTHPGEGNINTSKNRQIIYLLSILSQFKCIDININL
jgi:hypothetical protein